MRHQHVRTATGVAGLALALASAGCRRDRPPPRPPGSYVAEPVELIDSGLAPGTTASAAERVRGAAVSPAFFVAGRDTVRPVLGRFFVPGEYRAGTRPVLVLTHAFWQRRYRGRPQIIGRTVRVNGQPTVVVGVTAPGLDVPGGLDVVWPRVAENAAPSPRAL